MVCARLSMVTAGFLLLAGAAEAHHSRAMFDLRKSVELSGTVREFQWTNPHCYIQLMVTNAQGLDEEWSIEMGPPHSLRERGWGKYAIKPGDRVKVTIAPLRKGGRAGELATISRPDGSPLGKLS